MLTQRRAEILGMVVDEYVSTATPVSSRALVGRSGLDVSSATIRNELARLENDGYITHPYTSAGRVPSDHGYRFYVRELMAEEPVGLEEQLTIRHQFHQVPAHLEEWLRLASSILAAAVGNVAVITRPRAAQVRLRQVQFVHLHEESLLVVAVLDDGRVEQRMVALDAPVEQARLSRLAARLNEQLAGLTAREMRALVAEIEHSDERMLGETLASLLGEHVVAGDVYVDGLRIALRQPEFDSTERMLEAVEHLQAYHLRAVLPAPFTVDVGEAQITIGDEHPSDWLHEWSVVASTFGDDGELGGTIAVLGPTRMRYGHTVPRVRYVASLMSTLLGDLSRS